MRILKMKKIKGTPINTILEPHLLLECPLLGNEGRIGFHIFIFGGAPKFMIRLLTLFLIMGLVGVYP